MTITEQLHHEIDRLPEPLAHEVLNYLLFIRFRQNNTQTEANSPAELTAKALYAQFEQAGLIDGIDAEPDLSENYKQHLWKS